MIKFIENPISVWLYKLISSIVLEFKYRNKHLKIHASSIVRNCSFGLRNTIYKNVSLYNVKLNDFTYVANNTKISNAEIGKFCSIGSDSKIGIGKHPASRFVSTHPIFFSTQKQAQITFSDQSYFDEYESILIGHDVWIGSNVIILDGVSVGDGAVVAAGAIVTKDIPPYAVVGGVPAKIIKYRHEKNEIEQLLKLKWWDMEVSYLQKNFKKFHDIKNLLKS